MISSKPVALSAMHHRQLELGAEMVEVDGWQRPVRYTTATQELERVRRTTALCDVSPAGKLRIQGEELDTVCRAAFGDVPLAEVGGVAWHRMPGDTEAVPVALARLASDEVLAITAPNLASAISETIDNGTGRCAHVVDVTSGLAGVKVTGPSAHLLLAGVAELDLAPEVFANMSCAQAKVAEIHGVILRHDVGGLLSYDLYFDREFGEYMWDALMEAGRAYEVTAYGMEALSALEKGEA